MGDFVSSASFSTASQVHNTQETAALSELPQNAERNTTDSYKTVYLPGLGIDVKVNPSISEVEAFNCAECASVHRLTNEGELAMTTPAVHGMVDVGNDVVLSVNPPYLRQAEPAECSALCHTDIKKEMTPLSTIPRDNYTVVEGQWLDKSKVQISAPGNTFGNSGLFKTANDKLTIPQISQDSEHFDAALKAFGVKLFNDGDVVPLKFEKPLTVGEYQFCRDENKDYRMTIGNGFFVERHEFPHMFKPASAEDEAVITIARQTNDTEFAMIDVIVPHGSSLLAPGGTIHSDGLSHGNLVICLDVSADADVVLIHDQDDRPIPMENVIRA